MKKQKKKTNEINTEPLLIFGLARSFLLSRATQKGQSLSVLKS
jgi:hypothetical protein